MAPCSTPSRPGWLRPVAVLTLLAFGSACHAWKVVPLKEVEEEQAVKPAARIRVHVAGGQPPVTMEVGTITFPTVEGVLVEDDKPTDKKVSVDLRQATQIEVWAVDGWRTALLSVGIVVGVLAVVALIVALTKTSCPFVYVDGGDGLRFVGEAYSGATSRATQRDDLLPLPALGARARMVLSNEARETQLTDRLELVLVDRPPGLRALATPSADALVVGRGAPPRAAADLEGRDVLPLLRDADGAAWQTDLAEAARRPDPPRREGLVATFAAPPGGGPAALELEAGNTPWLDVVFGRFFALFGDRLARYQEQTDLPESRASTLAWREREGVDLTVEVERAGRWERVAVVPTVGPASLRRFAVPLPPLDGPEVRVRLTGGVGFWTVDRAALAPVRDARPRLLRVAPERAVQSDGGDVRAQLAAADGDYQVLADRGERVELAFALPAVPPGLERDAFLSTSGFYRVHPPPQAELSTGTLLRLRDEPGSLSRFSVDLYRAYEEAAAGPVARAP
jgi:hypothetical protein